MGSWPILERISSILYKRQAKLIVTPATTTPDEKENKYQIPSTQRLLLLHAPKQDYQLAFDHPVPLISADHEIIVRITGIGLNPIDWKGPAFNFGIPELPYISGREFVGEIVHIGGKSSRLKLGDRVLIPSTDYRDKRKAAFQQYAVASDFNAIKLPKKLSTDDAATVGVAFVAAVLALGICTGIDFSNVASGPNLLRDIRRLQPVELPQDVQKECFEGISEFDRAKAGDWVAIWGGSSATAVIITQLAQLAGLKVISIVDQAKHGHRFTATPTSRTACTPDVLVDSHDPERAIRIVKEVTRGGLRFGIDTRGKDTASHLLQALSSHHQTQTLRGDEPSLQNGEISTYNGPKVHLVGFSGLPKLEPQDPLYQSVALHSVPIKVFHEVATIGEAIVTWLERLLVQGKLKPPEVVGVEEGLEGVNRGLMTMRKHGGRVVVRMNSA